MRTSSFLLSTQYSNALSPNDRVSALKLSRYDQTRGRPVIDSLRILLVYRVIVYQTEDRSDLAHQHRRILQLVRVTGLD